MKIVTPMLTIAIMLTGCDKAKHISGEEFKEQHRLGSSPMVVNQYVGEKDGRVYLSQKTMSLVGKKWREKILYAETEELPTKFLNQLRKEQTTFEQ